MKKVFRWSGWILFTLITCALVFEYSGISTKDTYLFSLNGASFDLGSGVYDLSPVVMGLIYLAMLISIIFASIHKRDYQVLCIANFTLSIPVFMVYHFFVEFYPPFGDSESPRGTEFFYLLYIYFSTILFALFIVYSISVLIKNSRKRKQSLS